MQRYTSAKLCLGHLVPCCWVTTCWLDAGARYQFRSTSRATGAAWCGVGPAPPCLGLPQPQMQQMVLEVLQLMPCCSNSADDPQPAPHRPRWPPHIRALLVAACTHQLALHRGPAALPRGSQAAALHCWRTLHTWATQHAPRLGLCTWLFMVSTIQAPAAPGHPPFQHWACCRCALPATLVHGGDGLQRLCKMCTTHTRAPCNAGAWHDPVRTNTRAVRLLPAAMQAATTPRGCAPLGLHNAVMRCGWCGCWSV